MRTLILLLLPLLVAGCRAHVERLDPLEGLLQGHYARLGESLLKGWEFGTDPETGRSRICASNLYGIRWSTAYNFPTAGSVLVRDASLPKNYYGKMCMYESGEIILTRPGKTQPDAYFYSERVQELAMDLIDGNRVKKQLQDDYFKRAECRAVLKDGDK